VSGVSSISFILRRWRNGTPYCGVSVAFCDLTYKNARATMINTNPTNMYALSDWSSPSDDVGAATGAYTGGGATGAGGAKGGIGGGAKGGIGGGATGGFAGGGGFGGGGATGGFTGGATGGFTGGGGATGGGTGLLHMRFPFPRLIQPPEQMKF
jgi:hypothetical protein